VSVSIDSPEQLPEAFRSTRMRSRALRSLRRDPGALIGAIVISILVFVALAAPVLAPYPDQGRGEAHVSARDLAPSSEHWFGTDHLGRDVLSRVIYGAQVTLVVSIASVLLGDTIGFAWGIASGYLGQSDLKAFQAMPFFNFGPELQFVGRYTAISSTDPNGIRLATYESRVVPGRGDRYDELYLGANYYFYGHRLKVQTGLQFADMDDTANDGGAYSGTSWVTGLRVGW